MLRPTVDALQVQHMLVLYSAAGPLAGCLWSGCLADLHACGPRHVVRSRRLFMTGCLSSDPAGFSSVLAMSMMGCSAE